MSLSAPNIFCGNNRGLLPRIQCFFINWVLPEGIVCTQTRLGNAQKRKRQLFIPENNDPVPTEPVDGSPALRFSQIAAVIIQGTNRLLLTMENRADHLAHEKGVVARRQGSGDAALHGADAVR